jgi:hypothetical protein
MATTTVVAGSTVEIVVQITDPYTGAPIPSLAALITVYRPDTTVAASLQPMTLMSDPTLVQYFYQTGAGDLVGTWVIRVNSSSGARVADSGEINAWNLVAP